MKYTTAILALAGVSYAQVDVIKGVISKAQDGIDALDTAGKNFNGDVGAVKSKGDDLISTLKSGQKTVEGSSTLGINDAVALGTNVAELAKHGSTLRDDFKAQIPKIEKAGACGTVRTELSQINDASKALINAVIDKVDQSAKGAAEALASQLTDVLNQAQSDFSESNCKDSSSGGGGSSSASASGSSKPTGSSAPTTMSTAGSGSAQPTGGSGSGECHKCEGGGGSSGSGGSSGGNSTGTNPPPVTAGASILAPAGALAIAIAAAFL